MKWDFEMKIFSNEDINFICVYFLSKLTFLFLILILENDPFLCLEPQRKWCLMPTVASQIVIQWVINQI